jgi:hypothetical protein
MVVNLNASSGALQPAKVQLNGGVAQNQTTPPVLSPGGTLHNLALSRNSTGPARA